MDADYRIADVLACEPADLMPSVKTFTFDRVGGK